MRRLVVPWVLTVAPLLHAQPAGAVDASGTWAASFSSSGFGCFEFTGTIVATTTTFDLTSEFIT
jgi:hypothetical protein